MNNNDRLRRLRFALNIDDDGLIALFGRGGLTTSVEQVWGWLGREGEPGTMECTDDVLFTFLDTLIVDRRGPPPAHVAPPPEEPFSNNLVLKKLRIALKLRDTDMLECIKLGGRDLSKAELGGLLRNRDHKHYRPCGNQLMRAFLAGLTEKLRGARRS